jgi:serine/threonine-protein kinase
VPVDADPVQLHGYEADDAAGPGQGAEIGGRFRLGFRLEEGALGEVFRATDLERGRPCLVEVVARSGAEVADLNALAAREVAVCEQVREGGNVLRTVAWGRLGPERSFLAREMSVGARPVDLDSGSLVERVGRLRVVARTVGGIAKRGIFHRNLAPATILQDPEGAVRVTGFELVHLDGVEEPPLDLRGPSFADLRCAAPEALRDLDLARERADVYSLGALLYRAVTGEWPFPGPGLADLLLEHDAVRRGAAKLTSPSDLNPEVPDNLAVLCKRALAVDPSKRQRSARAFAMALEQWLEVETGEAPPPVVARPGGGSGVFSSDALAEAGARDREAAEAQAASIAKAVAEARAAKAGSGAVQATATPEAAPAERTSSTRVVLKEFPESLLPPPSAQASLASYRHRCGGCRAFSYVLPPMKAVGTQCGHCKKALLQPTPALAGTQSSLLGEVEPPKPVAKEAPAEEAPPSPAPAPMVAAVDALVEAVRADTSLDETFEEVIEFPESLAPPPELGPALAAFAHACSECRQVSLLLPPLTIETARCRHCSGQLLPAGVDPPEEVRAEPTPRPATTPAFTEAVVTATGARRIPSAALLHSLGQYAKRCAACGKTTVLLPPQTAEDTPCSHCGAELSPRGLEVATPRERPSPASAAPAPASAALAPAVAPAAIASAPETFNLSESNDGTGYVSWRAAEAAAVDADVEPAGKRVGRATARAPRAARRARPLRDFQRVEVRRDRGPGLASLLAVGFSGSRPSRSRFRRSSCRRPRPGRDPAGWRARPAARRRATPSRGGRSPRRRDTSKPRRALHAPRRPLRGDRDPPTCAPQPRWPTRGRPQRIVGSRRRCGPRCAASRPTSSSPSSSAPTSSSRRAPGGASIGRSPSWPRRRPRRCSARRLVSTTTRRQWRRRGGLCSASRRSWRASSCSRAFSAGGAPYGACTPPCSRATSPTTATRSGSGSASTPSPARSWRSPRRATTPTPRRRRAWRRS